MQARVLMIGLTMATALMAQPPAGGVRRNLTAPRAAPQQTIQREVDRLTRFLGLTNDQQALVSRVFSADTNNLDTLQGALATQRAAVLSAIKANSGVPAAVAALSATQSQIETIRANEAAQIYAALTADQKNTIGDRVSMLSNSRRPTRAPGPPR